MSNSTHIWEVGQLDPLKTPTLTQAIRIRNNSPYELCVAHVHTDCGCLMVGDRPRSIASGCVDSFTLKYNVGLLPGPVQRSALVDMIVGDKKCTVGIRMKGRVKALPILKSDPEFVDFGTLGGHDTSSTRHVHVTRIDGSSVDAIDVIAVPENAGVECELEELEGGARLTLTASDTGIPGAIEGVVEFRTLHAQHAILRIPFRLTRHSAGDGFVRCVAVAVTSEDREVSVPLYYEGSKPALGCQVSSIDYTGGGNISVRLAPAHTDVTPQAIVNFTKIEGVVRGTLHLHLVGVDEPIKIPLVITTGHG